MQETRRKWQGLDEVEVGEFLYLILLESKAPTNIKKAIKQIEQKLKEKNHDNP